MKTQTRISAIALAIVAGAGIAVFAGAAEQEATSPFTGSNYLYIAEFEISPQMTPNEAIAKASEMAREHKKTGEWTSVRLYIHNTGPRLSMYVLMEPKNWQSIETGFEKFDAANPAFLSEPWGFGRHSDNLLSEISLD